MAKNVNFLVFLLISAEEGDWPSQSLDPCHCKPSGSNGHFRSKLNLCNTVLAQLGSKIQWKSFPDEWRPSEGGYSIWRLWSCILVLWFRMLGELVSAYFWPYGIHLYIITGTEYILNEKFHEIGFLHNLMSYSQRPVKCIMQYIQYKVGEKGKPDKVLAENYTKQIFVIKGTSLCHYNANAVSHTFPPRPALNLQ